MAYRTETRREHKARSGIALGGIGAGWFELRQDGLTYDWNIFNNRPLGTGENFDWDTGSMLFFTIRYQEKGKDPKIKLLQIEDKYNGGGVRSHEHYYIVPWMSGVDSIEYEGSFPFIRMRFTDRDMPFVVDYEAFSPFVPHDAKNSALPCAIFSFSVTSKTKSPVDVMIVASMRNAVGYDVPERAYGNRIRGGKGFKAVEMTCDGVDPGHFSHGAMGLASLSSDSSWYLGWEHHHPYYEQLIRNTRLSNSNDTKGRNQVNAGTGRPQAMEYCFSSIARSGKLRKAGATFDHTFLITWCFPNLYARRPDPSGDGDEHGAMGSVREGHYYSSFFVNSTQVAAYVAANRAKLTRQTRLFNDAFHDSALEPFALDQINSNLNTYFTSSWFSEEGHFGILEGLNSEQSFAGLSTTDVAMYGSVSYTALFPELAMDLLCVYGNLQGENGKVAHSLVKNFRSLPPDELESPRLDMPGQYAFMVLRTFFWTGDRDFLRRLWPSVKKALDYVLRERDANGDLLPDMEGVMCSYDNFPMYGVAPYVAGQFLAAIQLAVEAAALLGDGSAVTKYGEALEKGRGALEETTWNGRYYRLSNDGRRKDEGCLTDQMIGQWAAYHVGLGPIFDPRRVRWALKSIMNMNYKPDYGLRNCQWPGDAFLHDVDKNTWIDQANTVWTGVELAFASFLLYEGMYKDGMRVIKNVDDRYRRWGLYWDHQEFGGRYFRPMSSWMIVNAALGLTQRDGRYTFAPRIPQKDCKLFFVLSDGYGHYCRQLTERHERITLEPVSGVFRFREIECSLTREPRKITLRIDGRKLSFQDYALATNGTNAVIRFNRRKTLRTGSKLEMAISTSE